MRLEIRAVGRLRASPERELVERYRERIQPMARGLGLSPLEIREIEAVKAAHARAQIAEEAMRLGSGLGPDARLIALDERGRQATSEEIARLIARAREEGIATLAFLIGGAEGLDPAFREAAHARLAFGRATWPHMLARAMLAEQIYRACCVLARHPYHRRLD